MKLDINKLRSDLGYKVKRNKRDKMTVYVSKNISSKLNPFRIQVYFPNSKSYAYIGSFSNMQDAEECKILVQKYLNRCKEDSDFNVDDCREEIGYTLKRQKNHRENVYVYFSKYNNKNPWVVIIRDGKKPVHFGSFRSKEIANQYADKVVEKLKG